MASRQPKAPGASGADGRAACSLEKDDRWCREFGSKSIASLFWEQAGRTPDAPAIRDHLGVLTYGEFAGEVKRLAARMQMCGVRPGDVVVLETIRSRESIVALVATLTAGAAYLALDPESPAERLALMLAQARPALILRQAACGRTLPSAETPTLDLDAELISLRSEPEPADGAFSMAEVGPEDLAYVGFTSGSTGTPKGVCIPHRGVVRLVKEPDYVSIAPSDIILRFAPLSFDASTFEVWGSLLNGASLAIFPPEKPSLTEIGEFIEREKVSLLWLTAGLFHQMVDGHLHYLLGVRQLIVGGDVLSARHIRTALQQLPHCRLINGYGPTENTTFTCCYPIKSVPAMAMSVPIGRPINRTYCRVLDADGKLVEAGSPGELYIGGDGLALGYLGDPSLTAEKFIADPYSQEPGARLYRSGDRVRELANGCYTFLGRVDRQVKASGVRVELDEIEAALGQHPRLIGSAVQLLPAVSGYEQLAATVAPRKGEAVSADELRDFLRERLPGYMIPSTWTFLPSLPLNANGKVDRAKLQTQEPTIAHGKLSVPDEIDTEEALTGIWREVLGVGGFEKRDNFFALGGTSLRATHLLARVRTVLGKSIPMSILREHGTIEELVRYLDDVPRSNTSPIHVFRSAGSKPPLFCLPSYAGDLMCYADLDRYFAPNRPVYGIQSQRFVDGTEERTIQEIAASCLKSIVRQRNTGPYHLFGFCFGGLLAYEIACQLSEQGAEVGMVAALDYEFPDPDPSHSWRRRPAGLIAFLRNLGLGLVELGQMPRAQLTMAFRRLGLRTGGLLRGQSWEEALHSGLRSARATEEERIYETHDRAWRSYVAGTFPGKVTLLRARRLPIFRSHDPALGWNAVASGGLGVRIVGGGWHGSALKEPNAASLTRALEECMADAERERAEAGHSPIARSRSPMDQICAG